MHRLAEEQFKVERVAKGISTAMHKAAFQVNAYWFPDTYLAIANYFETEGVSWNNGDPKAALGVDFSNASGYRELLTKITPPERQGGGGCGV